MEAVLFRTGSGSIPVQNSTIPGSPRVSIQLNDSVSGAFSGGKSNCSSPRICMQLEHNQRGIRRTSSESDVNRLKIGLSTGSKALSKLGSRSFPERIPEEDFEDESDTTASSVFESIGSLALNDDRRVFAGSWPEFGIPMQEIEFHGGSIGKSWKINEPGAGGGNDYSTGGGVDRSKIGAYYEEKLKLNPTDSLLLRNYGKYLHEVEKNTEKAEQYYGRAILASPGDGEVLSLYGNLIWETQRDESRAKCYFDQAIHASPDDCMVLGSYAHFMWETEEDEEDEEVVERQCVGAVAGAAMVGAY